MSFMKEIVRLSGNNSVYYAFLEFIEPDFETLLKELAKKYHKIDIIPVFLFSDGHLKNDFLKIIECANQERPSTHILLHPPMTELPNFIEVLNDSLRHLLTITQFRADQTDLLFVGRGMRGQEAYDSFLNILEKLLPELVSKKYCSFLAIRDPKVREQLRAIQQNPPGNLIVLPFLLFPGLLHDNFKKQIDNFRKFCPKTTIFCLPPLFEMKVLLRRLPKMMLIGNDL